MLKSFIQKIPKGISDDGIPVVQGLNSVLLKNAREVMLGFIASMKDSNRVLRFLEANLTFLENIDFPWIPTINFIEKDGSLLDSFIVFLHEAYHSVISKNSNGVYEEYPEEIQEQLDLFEQEDLVFLNEALKKGLSNVEIQKELLNRENRRKEEFSDIYRVIEDIELKINYFFPLINNNDYHIRKTSSPSVKLFSEEKKDYFSLNKCFQSIFPQGKIVRIPSDDLIGLINEYIASFQSLSFGIDMIDVMHDCTYLNEILHSFSFSLPAKEIVKRDYEDLKKKFISYSEFTEIVLTYLAWASEKEEDFLLNLEQAGYFDLFRNLFCALRSLKYEFDAKIRKVGIIFEDNNLQHKKVVYPSVILNKLFLNFSIEECFY